MVPAMKNSPDRASTKRNKIPMKQAKWLILVCLMNFETGVFAVDDAYCDGFLKGFSQRYCLITGKTTADALPPSCPDPVMGADSAQDGYNRGFLVGLDAALFCVEGKDSQPEEQPQVPSLGFSRNGDLQQ